MIELTDTSNTLLIALMLSLMVTVLFLTTLIWTDRAARGHKGDGETLATVSSGESR